MKAKYYAVLLLGLGGACLQAQTLQILKSFDGALEGGHPLAGLVEGSDGGLYGTTSTNGSLGGGTLFQLSKDGKTFAVLHSFGSPGDGSSPQAGLVAGTNGMFYGTTYAGGGTNAYGTVFEIYPGGTGYSVVHTFVRSSSVNPGLPETPQAALFLGSDGVLYGTSSSGGGLGGGAVFKLNQDGSGFAMLHAFYKFFDPGVQPRASLVEGANGALYGTTWTGTTPGTVFKLDKDGNNYVDVHKFSVSGLDGANPLAELLVGSDGVLYGTTYGGVGGGAVFKLTQDGSGYSTLHIFGAGDTGCSPEGGLVEGPDGFLYGTTVGATGTNWGTIFKLSKDGSVFSTLHVFTGAAGDGLAPKAHLLRGSDGNFYGTTEAGGAKGAGVVFVLSLASGVQPLAPKLDVEDSNSQVTLSWPATATNYTLETSASLASGTTWTQQTTGITSSGSRFYFTNVISSRPGFFRLHQQ